MNVNNYLVNIQGSTNKKSLSFNRKHIKVDNLIATIPLKFEINKINKSLAILRIKDFFAALFGLQLKSIDYGYKIKTTKLKKSTFINSN